MRCYLVTLSTYCARCPVQGNTGARAPLSVAVLLFSPYSFIIRTVAFACARPKRSFQANLLKVLSLPGGVVCAR